MQEERVCLSCGETLKGRVDKKFCSDQCRNNYNNQLNSDSTNYMRTVNNILRKNRRILSELNPQNDKARVHKSKLLDRGFNFQFITSQMTTKAGSTYYFCYEQGYLPLDNDFYLLVVRKEAVAG